LSLSDTLRSLGCSIFPMCCRRPQASDATIMEIPAGIIYFEFVV